MRVLLNFSALLAVFSVAYSAVLTKTEAAGRRGGNVDEENEVSLLKSLIERLNALEHEKTGKFSVDKLSERDFDWDQQFDEYNTQCQNADSSDYDKCEEMFNNLMFPYGKRSSMGKGVAKAYLNSARARNEHKIRQLQFAKLMAKGTNRNA